MRWKPSVPVPPMRLEASPAAVSKSSVPTSPMRRSGKKLPMQSHKRDCEEGFKPISSLTHETHIHLTRGGAPPSKGASRSAPTGSAVASEAPRRADVEALAKACGRSVDEIAAMLKEMPDASGDVQH
jgi:hypothetical protein